MSSEIIVIGGGARGLMFTQMLTQHLGRKVAAIADPNIPLHEAIRHRIKEFGTPDTRVFETADEALSSVPRSQADIVFVMTPEWTRLDVFRKAVNAGCHVFLEKPLAATANDVLDIQKIADSTDRVVQVGFVLRYSAFYRSVKQIIESKTLGRLVTIQMNERLALQHGGVFKRNWYRKVEYTGGFLNEKCCHDLDLMCWFMEGQSEPTEVYSYAGKHFCPPGDYPEFCSDCSKERCPWRFAGVETLNSIHGRAFADATSSAEDRCVFNSDADVADHQVVNVIFDDGSHGVLTVIGMSADPGRDLAIHGTDGYLEGSLERGRLRVCNYWDGKMRDIDLETTDGHGGGDGDIVSGFLKCVEVGERPLATVHAGVRASMLAFAAEESVESRRAVSLAARG